MKKFIPLLLAVAVLVVTVQPAEAVHVVRGRGVGFRAASFASNLFRGQAIPGYGYGYGYGNFPVQAAPVFAPTYNVPIQQAPAFAPQFAPQFAPACATCPQQVQPQTFAPQMAPAIQQAPACFAPQQTFAPQFAPALMAQPTYGYGVSVGAAPVIFRQRVFRHWR